MIQSMTGFAAASAETPRGRLSVELRSVNARFLDLQFRIADELRALEPTLRELVTARAAARACLASTKGNAARGAASHRRRAALARRDERGGARRGGDTASCSRAVSPGARRARGLAHAR